jgi:hypothetical protein
MTSQMWAFRNGGAASDRHGSGTAIRYYVNGSTTAKVLEDIKMIATNLKCLHFFTQVESSSNNGWSVDATTNRHRRCWEKRQLNNFK